jgi:hypothetical protein
MPGGFSPVAAACDVERESTLPDAAALTFLGTASVIFAFLAGLRFGCGHDLHGRIVA